MKKLLEILKNIFAPSPFKLGIVTTLIFLYTSYQYYITPPNEAEQNPILNILNIAHQKSVDIRITERGELPVTSQIALIVADEESLERYGRWPWPRSVFAAVIDKLRESEVKTVAFDIIFSEKEHNPNENLISELKKKKLGPDIQELIDREVEENNNDAKFAQAIEKFSDKVVMGSYFDQNYNYEPFQESCAQIIDESSPEYTQVENQESPVLTLDQSAVDLPSPISDFLKIAVKKIATDIEKQNPNLDSIEVRKKTLETQEKLCLNFLANDQSISWIEKNWITFQSQSEDLKSLTARDWIEQFKAATLKNPINHAGRFWMNIPVLSEKSKHYGYFNAFQDNDGYIRRTKLVSRYGGQVIPSLALKAVLVAQNRGVMAVLNQDPNNPNSKMISELSMTDPETSEAVESIPVDSEGRINVNYAGPQKMFPHISVSELLSDSDKMIITQRINKKTSRFEVSKKDFLKDKILFVGATAVGIYDLRVTPFEENFPGLETHANIAENILNQQYFKSIANEPIYILLFILFFGLIFSYAVARAGAVSGSLISLGSILGVYAGDKYLLFANGTVICVVLPLLLISINYVLLTFYKYLTEERKKKELKGTFQKYVSPAIVNEILSHPEKINLGGRKENMTVMFSDVRGFTTLAEKLDPEVLSAFLNRYLTPMTQLVFKNDGTLDKYIGDAIMAFFGAPIAYKDHAKKCCTTALQMIDKLHDLNKEFEKQQLPPIDIGIGINSGDMSVGNMGSDIVRSYTVMGDNVNLAARLEGINKTYGTRVIISEFTYEKVKNDFTTRELDWVRVKGKLLPVKIYELLSNKKLEPNLEDAMNCFKEGFSLYHNKKFPEALDIFTQCLNKIPNDLTTKLYMDRCQDYMQDPPSENWDGVHEFKTK